MQIIVDSNIIPYFKRDDYIGGIESGVDEVILELTGRYPGEYDASAVQRVVGSLGRLLEAVGGWIWLVIGPVLAIPMTAYRRWKRNKPRICPRDGSEMVRLDEIWDDNHLQEGQIREEQLRSVDYDVWDCPKCEHVTVEGYYRAWFSQYGACRSCGYRTVEGDTTILKSATSSSTGKKRIDYHCHHCQDQWSVTRIIPKKSSSSSSGGSFGGGSSSGGGASGSW